MKIRYIFFQLFVIFWCPLAAQPPETIYLGNIAKSGYANNASYGPFDIGFDFTFFGNTYSQFWVSSNGLITLGTGSYDATEDPIPSADLPNNFIAPFWDDLIIDPFGNILYKTIGASPNRKLIIQFRNMGFFTTPQYLGTFSVILYEIDNKIQIQYRTIVLPDNPRATGGDATIGIENIDGTSGAQYIYHTPNSVFSRKAISFIPSGSSYTLNSDEVYDGIYLTTNITLPEPGITELISPSPGTTLGTSVDFEWASSPNATSYSLQLGLDPSLIGATNYSAGSSLTYNLTGLLPDTVYYWTVFAINSTGYTWNEVRSFRTSSSPPLTAVPRTVWVEQGTEKLLKIQYTGGDGSTVTATVTSLPAKGKLYQSSGGTRGAQITAVPAQLTDPDLNFFYLADGGTGNGAGSFNFYVTDNTGNSPEATFTINVNPPGAPNVLLAARSTGVEIQFDRTMNDPAGKQSQFAVTVDGNPVSVTSVALKTGDPYSFSLTLATPLTGSETVFVSYTQGDVTATNGGYLLSFVNEPVTLLAQTINFPVIPVKKYGDPDYSPGASASGGGAITYSSSNFAVATIVSNKIRFMGVGTSVITARQVGNTTYAPARYERLLTVIKGDQTINFSPLPDKTYGDADFIITATATSGLPVSFSSSNTAVATVTGNTVHIAGAGTTTITASQPGNENYNPATNIQQNFIVNKANQTITFNPLPEKIYGDSDFTITATATSGLSVSFSSSNTAVATVTGNTVHIAGAGTTTITASQPGNENYNPATNIQQNLIVNKANQTITFNPLPDKTYGDADFTITATATSGLPVSFSSSNTAVATVTGNTVHIAGAGTTTITASQPGNENYKPATDVQQNLIVNKANQTITFNPLPDKTYGDADFTITATATSGLPVSFSSSNTAVATVTGNTVHIAGAGTTTITASQPGNENYKPATDVQQNLIVNKALQVITITRSPQTMMVTDTFKISAVSSSGLPVSFESTNSAVISVTSNIITAVSKGTAYVKAFNAGNNNYLPADIMAPVEVVNTHKEILHLFTPNGDGINDYWELPQLQEWGRCEVKVYNRWGKLVYDNPDYNNLWDGTSNGNPLPEGAYYFVIKTENSGTVKGTVNIVR